MAYFTGSDVIWGAALLSGTSSLEAIGVYDGGGSWPEHGETGLWDILLFLAVSKNELLCRQLALNRG